MGLNTLSGGSTTNHASLRATTSSTHKKPQSVTGQSTYDSTRQPLNLDLSLLQPGLPHIVNIHQPAHHLLEPTDSLFQQDALANVAQPSLRLTASSSFKANKLQRKTYGRREPYVSDTASVKAQHAEASSSVPGGAPTQGAEPVAHALQNRVGLSSSGAEWQDEVNSHIFLEAKRRYQNAHRTRRAWRAKARAKETEADVPNETLKVALPYWEKEVDDANRAFKEAKLVSSQARDAWLAQEAARKRRIRARKKSALAPASQNP